MERVKRYKEVFLWLAQDVIKKWRACIAVMPIGKGKHQRKVKIKIKNVKSGGNG